MAEPLCAQTLRHTYAGVCDAHLVCHCKGASPAARGPSGKESHTGKRLWQLHDENVMGDKGEGDKGSIRPF